MKLSTTDGQQQSYTAEESEQMKVKTITSDSKFLYDILHLRGQLDQMFVLVPFIRQQVHIPTRCRCSIVYANGITGGWPRVRERVPSHRNASRTR